MSERPKNFLLQQLSPTDYADLRGHLSPVYLEKGATVFEQGQTVDRVLFPETGLLSIITVMASGSMTETSMVGRDSGAGFVEAVGSQVIFSRVIVQVPGVAWSVSAARYREAFDGSATFRRAIHSNIELQLALLRQNMACNSMHRADQRLARWLLDCQELGGCGDELPLTQEFLAAMLSVQRTTVTLHAGKLEEQGLIQQKRGGVRILDRDGLERTSCECRATAADLRRAIDPEALTLNDA
ncbi:Crp/Fnr family transcriptional regulator [Phenylobacterium sp. 20VBR1]|uniref:Crp/Fnr family transcriptional regulator n=2 Tax=Phenylobacterium glaciei TaxID=2803784 RepID=A0A941CXS4_9CAUL|nr:Crp/Fnr family transcriptional regulator [Phenylobacterium glaciei]MBR7618655.1 Crp/Fnr family transcriptional regulator [Phenylobacterium glaciei]